MSRHVDSLVYLADELAGALQGLLDKTPEDHDPGEDFATYFCDRSDDIAHLLNRYEEARADVMYAMTKRSVV